ncbi:hypothetical protein HBA54_19280 [Pelagibius litoralis]|uniref:Uncharacterized protein n=1 Tax=Pelagibius litoralis TaxID=374515 RepID=A0A967F0I1_9PROT|nr:hypothetical protein [Pelagibius litoralis]NIA70746.1 hypothetical protein [Pelagibius litoralis]
MTPKASVAAAALELIKAVILSGKDGAEMEIGPVHQVGVQIHGKWRVTVERVEEIENG